MTKSSPRRLIGGLHETLPANLQYPHRCLIRHGISKRPNQQQNKNQHGQFAPTKMGCLHIDSCELHLEQGEQHMFLTIARITKFTHVAIYSYTIHPVPTDNGIAFTEQARYRNAPTNRFVGYIVGGVCRQHGIIKHKLTKPYHPWTNGQAERMNLTLEDATITSLHHPNFDVLKTHARAFSLCTTSRSI